MLPHKTIISPQKSNIIELYCTKTKLKLQSIQNQCTLTVATLGKRIKRPKSCKGRDKWKSNYQFDWFSFKKKKRKKTMVFHRKRSAFTWAMHLNVRCNSSQCYPDSTGTAAVQFKSNPQRCYFQFRHINQNPRCNSNRRNVNLQHLCLNEENVMMLMGLSNIVQF